MNIENRKRLSQNMMMDLFTSGGVNALDVVLGKFPNAKPTFRKFIDSLKGLNKDTAALEAVFRKRYGSKKNFVQEYDSVALGKPEEIALDNEINQGQVYIVAREQGVEPIAFLRADGGRGRGAALYDREAMRLAVQAHFDAKRDAFRESYDPSVEVTTADVNRIAKDMLGLDSFLVYPLIRTFNLPIVGRLRASGGRGRGTSLFRRDDVIRLLNLVAAHRHEGEGEGEGEDLEQDDSEDDSEESGSAPLAVFLADVAA